MCDGLPRFRIAPAAERFAGVAFWGHGSCPTSPRRANPVSAAKCAGEYSLGGVLRPLGMHGRLARLSRLQRGLESAIKIGPETRLAPRSSPDHHDGVNIEWLRAQYPIRATNPRLVVTRGAGKGFTPSASGNAFTAVSLQRRWTTLCRLSWCGGSHFIGLSRPAKAATRHLLIAACTLSR